MRVPPTSTLLTRTTPRRTGVFDSAAGGALTSSGPRRWRSGRTTGRRATFESPAIPAACRWALIGGVLGCLSAVAFVMTPALLIVLSHAATLRGSTLPIDAIATPLLAGYALAAGLLALTALSRSRALAWIFACAAVAAAIGISLTPHLTSS